MPPVRRSAPHAATTAACIVLLTALSTHTTAVGASVAAPPLPLPSGLPDDWRAPLLAGNLFYSSTDASPMPQLGNGFVSTIMGSDTLFAAGLFNGACKAGTNSVRARIPPFDTTLASHSVMSRTVSGGGFGSGQALDVRRAMFLRRGTTSSGIDVDEKFYAHQTRPSVMVHSMSLSNTGAAAVTVDLTSAQIGADSADIDFAVVPPSATAAEHGVPMAVLEHSTGEVTIPPMAAATVAAATTRAINGSTKVAEVPSSSVTTVAMVSTVGPANVTVNAGSTVSLTFLSAVCTSLNSSSVDPLACAQREYAQANVAALEGELQQEHEEAWEARWDAGRIEVLGSGDLELAQAINASMYGIRSAARSDFPYGTSPGGLATAGYEGHSFWDMDTWMFPSFVITEPDLARSFLQYRADRRTGAESKAAAFGYNGTMFPWESANSGYECQIGPWGNYEHHISGDIAVAASQYYYGTGDKAWLKSTGYPLVSGIADFWASRSAWNTSLGKYTIDMVMAPDEFAYPVNNSAYTNAVANISLQVATAFALELGLTPAPQWATVGNDLFMPFDAKNNYIPEYDTYPRGRQVKQADVVLLDFPLGYPMPKEVRANNLLYYAANTDPNGPAMTWSAFAVGWMNNGNASMAEQLFRKGYQTVHEPFKVWTETVGGGCTPFITGAGGFLSSVVFGHVGVRLDRGAMGLQPPPAAPAGTDGMAVHGAHYMGCALRIELRTGGYNITVLERPAGAPALRAVVTTGASYLLDAVGKSATFARVPARIEVVPSL